MRSVDVWMIPLDAPPPVVSRLAALLPAAERAAGVDNERDRRRLIVARGALREILGETLAVDPARLRFARSPAGKPRLAWPAERPLHFSLAHSHRLALVALADGRAVGVDLERRRPLADPIGAAADLFTPRERAALAAMPQARRSAAFFAGWCRKEALLKAWGGRAATDLATFDVSLEPAGEARLLATRPDPTRRERWTLHHLALPSPYVGALAIEGPVDPKSVRLRERHMV